MSKQWKLDARKSMSKPREVVRWLEQQGFREVRQTGSHKQFRHPDGRCTTVPFHPGRDVPREILRQIRRDIGLTK